MTRTITQLSSVLCQTRRICSAIALLAITVMVVGCGPSDPIEQAREQMAAGEYEESLALLRELIGVNPDDPELLFLYGRALVEMGQPGLATWPLRKAMEDPRWYKRSAMLVASVESAGGNMDNAAAIYSEILEQDPDNVDVRLQRANVCAKSPRLLEEALAEVDRILEIAPDELRAHQPRILAYLGLNMGEEAGQAIEELGERIEEQEGVDDQLRGWHCATMSIFTQESGDDALAAERWAVCEEDFPTHPNVVGQAVEFRRDRGELDRAIEIAEIAFADDSSVDSGYRLLLADLFRRADRPGDAESLLLEAAAEENPMYRAAGLLALTDHYKAVGDLPAAAESLERALVIMQQNSGPQPELIFTLADLLIQTGDSDRALELTQQMTVPAHRSLVRARVAHERKQYAKALDLYEDTSRLWPENPYAPYHAGRAAMSAGQFDRAFKNFLLAVRTEDGATDARCRAGRLLDADGKPGSAIEMLSGGRAGTTVECRLLIVEIMARTRGTVIAAESARYMAKAHPNYFGQGIAAAARGTRDRGDMNAAWNLVEPLLSEDLQSVNSLPILQAGVASAPGEEELALLRPFVARAVEANTNPALVREIEGMLFERSAALDQAATSYRSALDSEPNRITALFRLARITAESNPQGAIELIQRALVQQELSNDPFDPALFLVAIAELPDSPEIETLLDSALELAPWSGPIALRLGTMLEARAAENDRAMGLARRAIRFQQGEEAVALRDRVQARL
jgi:tetratricopeptide (TPR) repeat protein